MFAGTMLGQMASVLFSPILTRVYDPNEFGYLSVYMSVTGVLSVLAALGFEMAIPIAASDEEAANLIAVSGFSLGITTLILAAVMLVWMGWTAYTCLVPVGFACFGAYAVVLAAATRAGAFARIASTRISQGLSGPISQILLGLSGAGTAGLVIGFIIGQSSGTVLLLSDLMRRPLSRLVSRPGMRRAVRRYWKFPLVSTWSRLLEGSGAVVLFPLTTLLYSPQAAGFMFLTERVIARPLYIVSTSLLQAFVGEVSQSVHLDRAKLYRRFRQVLTFQFLFCSAWIGFVNVVANWAFPRLFGQQWDAAIPYLHAMSLAYFALGVLHPVSTSPLLIERQVVTLLWQAGRLLMIVLSIVVSWRLGASAVTAIWMASTTQLIACAVMVGMIGIWLRPK